MDKRNKEANMILNALNTEAEYAIKRFNELLNDYDNRMLDADHYGKPDDIIRDIEYWETIARDYTRLLFNMGDASDYFGGTERRDIVRNYKRLKC